MKRLMSVLLICFVFSGFSAIAAIETCHGCMDRCAAYGATVTNECKEAGMPEEHCDCQGWRAMIDCGFHTCSPCSWLTGSVPEEEDPCRGQ